VAKKNAPKADARVKSFIQRSYAVSKSRKFSIRDWTRNCSNVNITITAAKSQNLQKFDCDVPNISKRLIELVCPPRR